MCIRDRAKKARAYRQKKLDEEEKIETLEKLILKKLKAHPFQLLQKAINGEFDHFLPKEAQKRLIDAYRSKKKWLRTLSLDEEIETEESKVT